MKIYSPVNNFNGVRCNVRFTKGVGESDDPQVIAWFKNRGYKVDATKVVVQEAEEVVSNFDTSEFDGMTPNELRDWMKANGYGSQIKNIRNKEKLLDIIRRCRNG